MPEDLSPEAKLYVKEEIEKSRKAFNEEVDKVKAKATKTFSTVVVIVGLLTAVGVYGSAKTFMTSTINTKIQEAINGANIPEEIKKTVKTELGYDAEKTVEDLKNKVKKDAENAGKFVEEARASRDEIVRYHAGLKKFQRAEQNGYAVIGDIKFVWGRRKSTGAFKQRVRETFRFDPDPKTSQPGEYSFKECFIVIPSVPGVVEVSEINETGFSYKRGNEFGPREFTFVAIGR